MNTKSLRRARPAALVLAVVAASTVALVSCGDDNDSSGSGSGTPTPDKASFSGMTPSALKSAASSAVASARARASAAESSASAAASSFEASVSAEVARASKDAQNELKNVTGQGNAMSDVAMTGKPRAQTSGLLAVLVTITNKTDKKASYAVQVDFLDSSGKVVETRYVGAENLAPGAKAQPVAISTKPPEPVLTPKLAKAQRY
ncbi:FxLYD domain-containing protein [Streptomyces sp. W16]|uniref:FxLYD domain-containing protein n=1 Tax=Streptomyces sp. W16 TaxID=3076631 RepID=UPI00295C10BC|nr:FxLYD domain-containing protein [Streptomyces sp. W16]MDV9170906.1 FxLYD domain-containing protein [Streptomyces sp. W16]